MDWLNQVAGPNFVQAAAWTLLALVLLVIVLVVVRIVRSMTFGTYVAGGRNRKTRLAVMDAAAVDSQRRLVLVRRDDVEHLILIGGPTDVVVERDIKLHVPQRRPAPAAPAEQPDLQPRPRPAEVPAQPQRAERPLPPQPTRPEQRVPQLALAPQQPPPVKAPPPSAPSKPAAVRSAPTSVPPASAPPASAPPVSMPPAANLSTPRTPPPAPANSAPPPTPKLKPLDAPASDHGFSTAPKMRPRPELTLEDEMNRLLGELSNKK